MQFIKSFYSDSICKVIKGKFNKNDGNKGNNERKEGNNALQMQMVCPLRTATLPNKVRSGHYKETFNKLKDYSYKIDFLDNCIFKCAYTIKYYIKKVQKNCLITIIKINKKLKQFNYK